MKASELRLGNLFYLPNGEVGTISYHEIRLMVVALDKPNYQPIQLTEEWLLKFGFELEHEFTNAYKLYTTKHPYDCSNITYSINEKMLRFSNGQSTGSTLIPHVKYVHQLQNLFFALTGEELTLKP